MVRRGTTIVLSVLLLWMLLAVASGVATVLIGELKISGEVDGSVVAVYAADSGIECFLYQKRITEDLACGDTGLTTGASYDGGQQSQDGRTVRLMRTGSFRNTNRGLEVTYEE